MDHALGRVQGVIADLEREEQLALGVHRHPDPLGRPFQALDGFGRPDFMVLDRAEQGKEFIELHLPDPHVVQDVSGEGLQLLRCFDQSLQHGIWVHLKHPRRALDTQAFGQARDDAHDEIDGGALAVKDCAEGLEKIAPTGDAQQLPPGAPVGMAVSADIAPANLATIGTVWVGAEMREGIHLAEAPPCGHDAGWRGAGYLWTEVAGMRTGGAMRLFGEACKGFALALALWHWGVGSGVGGHVARSLGHVQWSMRHSHTRTISTNWEKKRSGTMAKPPSYRWSNEGILLGFQTVGISRRLEVHDRSSCTSNI
jgi:hypothetical protein